MPRADLDFHFDRIEKLVVEMEQFVPTAAKGVAGFRADLAGLLVMTTVASYESCVKETLISYAGRHHIAFANFATNNFKKLNSKISIGDLHRYTSDFDDQVSVQFKAILKKRKDGIDGRIGKNIETAYGQMLSWRHAFAHAGTRNTTIEEAVATHRLAKRVLYSFDDAFCGK